MKKASLIRKPLIVLLVFTVFFSGTIPVFATVSNHKKNSGTINPFNYCFKLTYDSYLGSDGRKLVRNWSNRSVTYVKAYPTYEIVSNSSIKTISHIDVMRTFAFSDSIKYKKTSNGAQFSDSGYAEFYYCGGC